MPRAGEWSAVYTATYRCRVAQRWDPGHSVGRGGPPIGLSGGALLDLRHDRPVAIKVIHSDVAADHQDAYFGALNTRWYAQVVALAGDVGRAVAALDELLTKPSPVTVAWLRADPTFDRLRGDARFAALLARAEGR